MDQHSIKQYLLEKKAELDSFVYSDIDEMEKIYLWDLCEDIGYVDECDKAIVEIVECIE